MRNLITNAIENTEEGKILLASHVQGSYTIIYVMDTGKGIDLMIAEDLFKPYIRGKNAVNETGLGLSLYIVINTLELLDHTLKISSSIDHGTSFKIIINNDKNN